MIDELSQFRHLFDIIRQGDAALIAHVELMLRILNGQHGQVVTLLCPVHKFPDSLRHVFHEVDGFVPVFFQCCIGHLQNPFLHKLVVLGVFCLSQTVGIEEDRGVRVDQCLLSHKFPVAHHTDRQVRFTW